jgi:hypothetical protein
MTGNETGPALVASARAREAEVVGRTASHIKSHDIAQARLQSKSATDLQAVKRAATEVSTVAPAAPLKGRFKRYCRECGEAFLAQRYTGEFCTSRCRTLFNNRRAERGRDLHDLVMEWRFERDRAGAAQTLISKLAAQFKLEDERERGGRRSWNSIDNVLARNPRLASEILDSNIAGMHRRGRRR